MDNLTCLRAYRLLRNLRQCDVGDAIGRSAMYVSLLERGRAAPTQNELQTFDRLLGFPVSTTWNGRVRNAEAER